MRFFRRESLHERLAREGGMLDEGVRSTWDEAGIHGIARAREWDTVVVAEAPAIEGEHVDFVALPDGSLLVEEEEGEAALDPLAAAVEARLEPPYRAVAARQAGPLWAVSARRIRVESFEAEGDRLELARTPEGKTLRVDGLPAFGSVPALERLGEAIGDAYTAHAARLDADLWEVAVSAL